MKCAICGKEKMLVYANMYLKNGACMDCYNQAKMVTEFMGKVLPVESCAGTYTVKRLDAFGKEVYRKQYKTKRWMQFIQKKARDLMGVNMQD